MANEFAPSKKQLEAQAMYEIWKESATPLKDALLWAYENGWYFQTEPNVWKAKKPFDTNSRSNLQRLIDAIADGTVNFIFTLTDTYIYFKSPNMVGGVLLREGASSDPVDANRWPNNVIQLEVGFRRHDSINKSVVLS